MNYNFYDKIVGTVLMNVLVEKERDEGIYLNGFDYSSPSKLYLQMAISASDLENEIIHLVMPFRQYVRFIKLHWKDRKRYKWCWNWKFLVNEVTPISKIMNCVSEYYKIYANTYDEIVEAYYE